MTFFFALFFGVPFAILAVGFALSAMMASPTLAARRYVENANHKAGTRC